MKKVVLPCLWNPLELLLFYLRQLQSAVVLKSSRPLFQSSHYYPFMTCEVLTSIMLEVFFSKYPERQMELEALQINSQSEELTGKKWYTIEESTDTIQAVLQVYLKERASLSQSFDY